MREYRIGDRVIVLGGLWDGEEGKVLDVTPTGNYRVQVGGAGGPVMLIGAEGLDIG